MSGRPVPSAPAPGRPCPPVPLPPALGPPPRRLRFWAADSAVLGSEAAGLAGGLGAEEVTCYPCAAASCSVGNCYSESLCLCPNYQIKA